MTKELSRVPSLVALALLLIMEATSVWAANDCDPMPKAVGPITSAQKISVPGEKSPTNSTTAEAGLVTLGDWIAVHINDLNTFLKEAKCRNKPLIVYLNGQPMKDLTLSTGGSHGERYLATRASPIDP